MSALWLVALAAFFGYLAHDASQFRNTSQHRVCSVPPASGRRVGEDPLAVSEQGFSRSHKYTGAEGIPGLHWVFLFFSGVCAAAGMYVYLVE